MRITKRRVRQAPSIIAISSGVRGATPLPPSGGCRVAGENLGHRLETVVAMHLKRKCKMEDLDVYYLNDRSGECDFVVCKGNQVVQAIHVSYDISAEKTRKRETGGLLLAALQTGCDNLLLLTDHESENRHKRPPHQSTAGIRVELGIRGVITPFPLLCGY